MMRLRSMRSQIGMALCGVSLTLFGCPVGGDLTDAGADGDTQGGQVTGNGDDTGRGNTGAPGGSNGGGSGNPVGNPGGGPTVDDRSAIVRPASPTLYVGDANVGVVSFANAHALNGNVAPTTFIDAFERFRTTSDLFPRAASAISVDRVGTLIVNEAARSLSFYKNAAGVSGTPAPDREILGTNSRLSDTGGMVYDRGNDRLLVATSNRVLVFEGVSLTQNGDIAPTRFFTCSDLPGGGSIALGPNGDLYMTDLLDARVLVFANAGLRTGEINPDRVIDLFIISEIVAVDSADRLYVAFNDRIAVADSASTLNGDVRDFREMRLAGVAAIDEQGSASPEIKALVIDSRGIGYASDIANAAIHVVDQIGTRTGDLNADRAITGPDVKFRDPRAIFLWE